MPNGPEDLTDQDRPIPFGVSAETGRPLPDLSDEALTQLSVVEQQRGDSDLAAQKSLEQADFAVTDVDDANDLSETGWGVVFAENANRRHGNRAGRAARAPTARRKGPVPRFQRS